MATQTSNIDELLMSGKNGSQQPAAPENTFIEEPEMAEDITEAQPIVEASIEKTQDVQKDEYGNEEQKPQVETDEYGNEKQTSKTYTEEEVNDRINRAIRDRLSRMERSHPQQMQQVQQQTQDGFQYNSDSAESWQQQLETFVEQTISKVSQKHAQQAYQAKEQHAQAEFEMKFQNGMKKFNDYTDVVGSQPITDAMVIATRGMKDPAAFMYAASKRAPQELQRISQISDQYTQMVEIGKLEERMKQTKPTTKAPKPLSKGQEDMAIPHKSDKQDSIEDLIARADAKKIAMINQRRK